MPQTSTYNTRAAGEALKLLGGDELVNKFAWLYDALDRAEKTGHEDGYWLGKSTQDGDAFDEGYDSGYADGHADGIEMFIDDNNVKENAQVEGFKFPEGFVLKAADMASPIDHECTNCGGGDPIDFEVVKAVAALDDSTPF